ncbi:response regulator transcription factor [Conexibacter sp. SYSU D00693]|uniref:response regulator transcription factor n=1 Tax=Conexibacter sp. SYSU D00693 TaxID=2812560 RepID=UPI00196B2E8D|nr:response regulator transcription factor [Conexibacter sp. SYSU D00693]
MEGTRILVVDDDPSTRLLLRELLERAGATVEEAGDGQAALRAVFELRPDLVVLDVSMPGMDGWQALERLRDVTEVPVLMLTSHAAELEKVRALQAGADDYVVKPFGRQELLARVGALLRRARRAQREEAPETYEDGVVRIDVPGARVEVLGHEVGLTPLEFRLLLTFVRHPGEVLTRERLLDLVWGEGKGVGADQVKLYVGYLRRKITQATAGDADPIETVRGFGYRWRGEAVAARD